jgi:outer membrane lipoprotein LolB
LKRIFHLVARIFAILLIASCASNTLEKRLNTVENSPSAPQTTFFSGRISLQVLSSPAQSFSGGFELQGDALDGSLSLSTPWGSTAARMQWKAGQAQLQSGANTQQFSSVNAMIEQTTGASIPIDALFTWLEGRSTSIPGWQADLADHVNGRISARRSEPAPQVQLRIVLDQ